MRCEVLFRGSVLRKEAGQPAAQMYSSSSSSSYSSHCPPHRECAQCQDYLDIGWFSNSQWSKGEGRSRCSQCVEQIQNTIYQCHQCGREFETQNNRDQHMQTHRKRTVECPGCGGYYKSATDAALHFETGYCPGCPGRSRARQVAYDYTRRHGRQFINDQKLLTYDGGGGWEDGGDNYRCPGCRKAFSALASLMQHQEAKSSCRGFSTPQLCY